GLGVFSGLVTPASARFPPITNWPDKSQVTREIFGNIPGPVKVIVYTVIVTLFLIGSWLFSLRVKNWERGAPDDRSTTPRNVKRRVAAFRSRAYTQTRLRDPAAGVRHPLTHLR